MSLETQFLSTRDAPSVADGPYLPHQKCEEEMIVNVGQEYSN